jgi:RNA polymerase sigma-70 factor (ECF subfamily)
MPEFTDVALPARAAAVVNRRHASARSTDMTKSPRERRRDVIELVEEPPRPGSATSPPVLPVPESFEEFYRRELARLLVLARALAGDLAAEDLAQESMMVAYRQWSRIGLMRSPAGYVRGICAHKSVSLVRRRLSEQRAMRRVSARTVSTVEPLADDGGRFWAEVRRLPRRQAQVTALFYALDLSVSEVAATLGCAEGTVKVHLSRARTELASRLGTTEEPS